MADVLVGRDDELGFAARALGSGGGGGLVLMGAAGVGKTRIARAVIEKRSGTSGAWVAGTRSARRVPFGAFAHLLPALDRPGLERLEVMMLARRAVLEAAGETSPVLVVDDAHLLDDASAALVHQLAVANLVSLVVTVRSGEPCPDAVLALWKDGFLECLELQPLGRVELEDLVVGLLGGQVDAHATARVWEATHGNALYACELVRAAVTAGVLAPDQRDVWRWRGEMNGTGRLWDVIDARLAELDADELAALEVLAVADGADAAWLDRLVDLSARARLARRGLVEVSVGDGRPVLALSHPLLGEAVRARMRPGRRRELCGRLADAAEQLGLAFGPEMVRVASWRVEQGAGSDPGLLVAAARRAQAGFDPALAERFARAALAGGAAFEAEHALAVALGTQGQMWAAEGIFERLEHDATNDLERVMVAVLWGQMLSHNGGRARDAAVLAGRVASKLAPGSVRDELRVMGAVLAWRGGDWHVFDRREEWSRIGAGSERLGLLVAFALAPALVVRVRPEEALEMIEHWTEPAARWRDALPLVDYRLRVARASALWGAGRLNDAAAHCKRESAAALQAGELEPAAMFAAIRGAALIDMGRIDTAVSTLRDALALWEELGAPDYVTWGLAFLAHALALAADAAGAQQALKRAELAKPDQIRIMDRDLGIARVWLAVAEGDVPRARKLALSLAADSEASGLFLGAARALHDVARLGDPPAVVDRLATLATQTDASIVPIYAAHAAALAARDAPALTAAGERFEQLGCTLWAVEAHAQAARVYESQGRAASARAADARAGALLAHCENVRTPALTSARQAPSLTPRERDVAQLAAQGLSNRDIAQRLVVSIRTVESHLASAYRKVGAKNRNELRKLFT